VGVKLPPFNAAEPLDRRQKASDEVLKLIKDGQLPPSGEPAGPAGAPPAKPPAPPGKP
jgi:hypothetical protein